MRITLIRHAESELNRDRSRIGGRSSWCEINALGVAQSVSLGRALRARGFTCDRIISSTAVRTQQTARHCLTALGEPLARIETTPELLEQDMGVFEGEPRHEVYTPERLAVIQQDPWSWAPPGGESQEGCALRALGWIERELLPQRETVAHAAIFTHGLVIRCLLTHLFDLDRFGVLALAIENTSVTTLEHDPVQGWTLVSKNDVRHLEADGLERLHGAMRPQSAVAEVAPEPDTQ